METTIIYNNKEYDNECCGCGGTAFKRIAPGRTLICKKGFICRRCLRHRPLNIYDEQLEYAHVFLKQYNMHNSINKKIIKPIIRGEKFKYLKFDGPFILMQFHNTEGGVHLVNVAEGSLISIEYPDKSKDHCFMHSIIEPRSMRPDDIYNWLKILER